jgi:uncharacterized SAM-binding protein YcdF (DUF218 family)
MFVLSKVGWLLVQPSNLIFLATGIGFAYLHFGRFKVGIAWIKASLVAAVIMGVLPFSAFITQPLETRFPRPDLGAAPVHGIIVLSGAEEHPRDPNRELLALNEAAERLTEAAALARRFPQARIFLSGGSGALDPSQDIPESQLAKRLLIALGVDASRLTLEERSRTTYENAEFTAERLKPNAGERWLLVTSAWHMPRAMGCFQRVGLAVLPWAVDYRTAATFNPFRIGLNVAEGLRRTDLIIKEYVGLLAYRLAGRTSALWPGPTSGAI